MNAPISSRRPRRPWHGFSTRALPALALTLFLPSLTLAQATATEPEQQQQQQQQQDRPARSPDVPFVPTPEEVVEKMLDMAAFKKGDVHYDLGCGDGRIVIAAAKRGAKKAVGVDINPERIKESNENAKQAGVTDKVKFVIDDLFTMDFKDADVVTLYLLPSVNQKLRPRLLDELKPGTRVVSHDFDMGDWKPDQESDVDAEREHSLFLWIIPAKVGGDWDVKLPDGKTATLHLDQQYQDASGSLKVADKDLPVQGAAIKGEAIRFAIAAPDGAAEATVYEGKLSGETLKGTCRAKDGQPQQWSATRRPTRQASAAKQ